MFTEFDERANEILKKLTLREKIGQLNQVSQGKPENEEKIKEMIRKGEVGSIIQASSSQAGNDEQKAVKVDTFNEFQRVAIEESPNGIPIIFGRDVIHGHHTVYPIPLASACAFNPELVKRCYGCIAKEAAAESIHWTFSPMLDVCHEPRWGRIIEGPGEDPYVGACLAKATVSGFQGDDMSDENRLAACAKHYLGYGASEGGRDYNRTEISNYTLFNSILPPFRAAVDAGVATVMSSFNDINGQPVSSSRFYLTDILRGMLGFEGYVISDWGSISQMVRQGTAKDKKDCARLALPAGLDMDMVDGCYIDYLEELVKEGLVDEKDIDTAVLRVLRVKLAKGLFDNPYCRMRKIDRTEHLKLAREMAAESMVLLKNENNLLPLQKNARIALIGPFVRERKALLGGWTLDGRTDETPTILEKMSEVLEANGGKILTETENRTLDASANIMYQADVVVLALGENQQVTGENRSLSDISLMPSQVELAKRARLSGKKVVGVVFCGRPVALQNIEPYLDAILCAWHSGSEAAGAACDILFGDRNPCGKTVTTFVRTSGHIPLYYNVTPSGRPVDGYYGIGSQSNYFDNPCRPMYPFGFGLSYTDFEISDISKNSDEITLDELKEDKKMSFSVRVKNTGSRAGKEVVQLYIRDKIASYMRPIRELKGFEKIFLEPSEEKEVVFNLGYKDLGFYLPNGDYTMEKGEFDIFIGNSSLTSNSITVSVK